MEIKSQYVLKTISSFISKKTMLKIVKYNNKIKKMLNISKYDYQKIFIENFIKNHNFIDISIYKISSLINYFKSKYKNFTEEDDSENLKKIILQLPQFQEFKKEKTIIETSENYRKISNYDELKILENLNLKELSNLKILNITFENEKKNVIEKQKEINLKDIFPNLIKLKIIIKKKDSYSLRDYERSKGPIFIISLNLFSQIEDLTLIKTCIKIENLTDGMIFPSLKNLKIKYTDIIGNLGTDMNFPNLKYFYSEENENVSYKKNSLSYYCFFWNVSLDEIHLKYPCLTFFKYIYNDNHGYEDFKEISMRKFENNFIKYEYKYAYNGHEDEYYYKKFSYFNNENNLERKDNYVEIYNFNGLVNNKILFEKSNNYSVQYIDIIIGHEYDKEKNIKNKIIDFIDNIKYFKFLKSICLIFETEDFINSKNLLILVNNLSKLKLLENIVILILGNINISKEDKNIILNKIKNIKIEKKKDYFLIELESEIFYEERFKRLKIINGILSEKNINYYIERPGSRGHRGGYRGDRKGFRGGRGENGRDRERFRGYRGRLVGYRRGRGD